MTAYVSQILIGLLFLSIVYVDLGSAELQCWRCDPCPSPHSNTSSSVSPVRCTSAQTVCVKNTVKVLNRDPQISKGCVETCTPSSSNFFGQGAFVDCCNTDYCNFSTRNQISSLLVVVLLMFIFYP